MRQWLRLKSSCRFVVEASIMTLHGGERFGAFAGQCQALYGLHHAVIFLGFGKENRFCNGTLLAVPGWRNW